jgi:hypothetical protein
MTIDNLEIGHKIIFFLLFAKFSTIYLYISCLFVY